MKNIVKKAILRDKIISLVRKFFHQEGFIEVETPILLPSVIPESYLEIFETNLINRQGKKKKMFLAASPEASIKKLLASGMTDCYEITKSFRNIDMKGIHNHYEFTMLEWYRINADYFDLMRDCEKLIFFINKKLRPNNKNIIIYQGKKIDISKPWERISVIEALKKYANIDFYDIINKSAKKDNSIFSLESISKIAEKKGYKVRKKDSWEKLFNQIFLNEVEPYLGNQGKPTIIFDYPKPLAALAKTKNKNKFLVERFEFYIAGIEMGDCYSELTDWNEQRKRFQKEIKERNKKKMAQLIPDENFLQSMKKGMPKSSGLALGLDRLIMLLTDKKKIEDVLLLPFFN